MAFQGFLRNYINVGLSEIAASGPFVETKNITLKFVSILVSLGLVSLIIWVIGFNALVLAVQNQVDYKRVVEVGDLSIIRKDNWLYYLAKSEKTERAKLYGIVPLNQDEQDTFTARSDSYVQLIQPRVDNIGIMFLSIGNNLSNDIEEQLDRLKNENSSRIQFLKLLDKDAILLSPIEEGSFFYLYFPVEKVVALTKSYVQLRDLLGKAKESGEKDSVAHEVRSGNWGRSLIIAVDWRR